MNQKMQQLAKIIKDFMAGILSLGLGLGLLYVLIYVMAEFTLLFLLPTLLFLLMLYLIWIAGNALRDLMK